MDILHLSPHVVGSARGTISDASPSCSSSKRGSMVPNSVATPNLSEFERFLNAKLQELQLSVLNELAHQFGLQAHQVGLQDGTNDNGRHLVCPAEMRDHARHHTWSGNSAHVATVTNGNFDQLQARLRGRPPVASHETQNAAGYQVRDEQFTSRCASPEEDPSSPILVPTRPRMSRNSDSMSRGGESRRGTLHDSHHGPFDGANLTAANLSMWRQTSGKDECTGLPANALHRRQSDSGTGRLHMPMLPSAPSSRRTSVASVWHTGGHPREDPHTSHKRRFSPDHQPGSRRTTGNTILHPILPRESAFSAFSGGPRASLGSIFGMPQIKSISAADAADTDMKEFQPYHYEVLHMWYDGDRSTTVKSTITHRITTAVTSMASEAAANNAAAGDIEPAHAIFGPNSTVRLLWNVTSIMMIAYDCFMIPMDLFDIPETHFILTMAWIVRCFWALDMFMSALTGYVKTDGDFENRLWPCVKHYLQTWFLLDFVIVFIDWLYVGIEGANKSAAQMGKSLRVLRLLRMSRLLRLARVVGAVENLFEHIHSEKVAIVAGLTKSMCLILCLIHVIACVWFGLGNTANGWVTVTGTDGPFSWAQYANSLHWSMTQFFGSPDVFPTTTGERFFNVCVLIFAFVAATWLVSSITSNMTRLHIISRGQQAQFALLRRYLFCHGISQALMTRVQLNAQHTMDMKHKRVSEGDVELLQLVSEPLLMELHYEIYSPTLLLHPFFHAFASASKNVVRKICHIGVHTMTLMAGDVLFQYGEIPTNRHMLFCMKGTLRYDYEPAGRESLVAQMLSSENVVERAKSNASKSSKSSVVKKMTSFTQTMSSNQWACEAVLWTNWVYSGTLQATDVCELMVLDGETFCATANKYQGPHFRPYLYADAYVKKLNQQARRVTDLGSSIDSAGLVREVYHCTEDMAWEQNSDSHSFAPMPTTSWFLGGVLGLVKSPGGASTPSPPSTSRHSKASRASRSSRSSRTSSKTSEEPDVISVCETIY